MCVCVPSRKICFPMDWRLLVEEHIANIGIPLDHFGFLVLRIFLRFYFTLLSFLSLRASLLYIIGELPWGGSVAVAVGFSDRWQVSRKMWHLTPDRWHMTFIFILILIHFSFLSVSVCFGISATIRTRQELQCLPYAGFLKPRPYPLRANY